MGKGETLKTSSANSSNGKLQDERASLAGSTRRASGPVHTPVWAIPKAMSNELSFVGLNKHLDKIPQKNIEINPNVCFHVSTI